MTNGELPGALEVAIRTVEQKWPHTVDAKVWAKEFARRFYVIDNRPRAEPASKLRTEEVMLGWFANAIMAGIDTARVLDRPKHESAGIIGAAVEERMLALGYAMSEAETAGEVAEEAVHILSAGKN